MGIGMINKSLVPPPAFQERAKKVYAFSCDDLKEKPIPKNKDSDRIEISEKAFLHLQVTGKQEDTAETVEAETDLPEDAENILSADIPEEEMVDDNEEITSESVSQSIGINAGKLARKLAAAKTKAQVQMVILQVSLHIFLVITQKFQFLLLLKIQQVLVVQVQMVMWQVLLHTSAVLLVR